MPRICLLFIFIFCFAFSSFGQHPNGIGARWGTLNGFTLKHWTNNINSIDGTLSYTIKEYAFLDLNYSWHFRGLIDDYTIFFYWSHGAFGGKSAGKGKGLAERFPSWYAGGSIRAGLSIPIGVIDFAVESGGRSTVYPKFFGEVFTEGIIRYWF
ncbi:MAG: hypothetical protein LCH54_16300 [Bacteroidetes bacterium]|nr:hypothetical protein [Bacteroidota bacterium]